MVEAHLFMFENLWRHATPAQFRIKELFYLEGPPSSNANSSTRQINSVCNLRSLRNTTIHITIL